MKYLGFALSVVMLSGCSTHLVDMNYEGAGGKSVKAKEVIGQVVVEDQRGTEADWLGAIRGGYGNRLKTLRTKEPTKSVVKAMYIDALGKNESTSNSTPYLTMKVVITKFDCSYYFNREAHAHVIVSLLDDKTAITKFSKAFRTDEVESGVGAGIFGSVDTLRQLAETTMNKTIDQTLSDVDFNNALAQKESNGIAERLNRIEDLYNSGVISEQEYRDKRASLISEL